MFKNIPAMAWIITALSGLTLSVGVSISTIKSSNLSVEFADFRLDSSVKFSKVLELSKELEQKAAALQEQKKAYQELETQFENLAKNNQPIQLLEPALQKVQRVNSKHDLDAISQELEQTSDEAVSQIEQLTEEEKKNDENYN